MKLEHQVCTRHQGERLAELGVTGSPTFCYCYVNPGGHNHEDAYEAILPTGFDLTIPDLATTFIADAWTVAELGVMLPQSPLPGGGIMYSWYHRNNWRGHSVGYSAPGQPDKHIERPWFKNEAEARADLLIYLLESKILTSAEVNTRLEQQDKE